MVTGQVRPGDKIGVFAKGLELVFRKKLAPVHPHGSLLLVTPCVIIDMKPFQATIFIFNKFPGLCAVGLGVTYCFQ
jgi:hypothetical protein